MTNTLQLHHSRGSEMREFLKLAVPLAGAQVAQSIPSFTDTLMMGRMGPESLAAGGLAAIIFAAVVITLSGALMGLSPLVAEAFGAGQRRRIRQLLNQGLWLSITLACPVMVVLGHMSGFLVSIGQDPELVALADTYLDTILWSLLPVTGFAALRATVSALSRAQPVMSIIAIGTVFNIAGNYALGFGHWGLPALGLQGLAIATTATWWGMFIALALYVACHPAMRAYGLLRGLPRLQRSLLTQLAWVGIPIGLFSGLESGFYMALTFLVGTLGTTALAAHQIVLQTTFVAFMVPLGISFATTVRVGQWFGRRDGDGIRRAAGISVAVTVGLMLAMSALFLGFPQAILGIYFDVNRPENAEILAHAQPLLLVIAFSQILDGFQKAVYGSLQGLQDTRFPAAINVVGYWGLGLGSSYGLGLMLGWGAMGLWLGHAIATLVVAVTFARRLFKLVSPCCKAETDAEPVPATTLSR